jgi:hypothetical protein
MRDSPIAVLRRLEYQIGLIKVGATRQKRLTKSTSEVQLMKTVSAHITLATILAFGSFSGMTVFSQSVSAQSVPPVQSVDNLRDVAPTDWAYTAIKNLVENYGCLSGYPDGTFRGDRGMTRNEFAAALSNCINAINARVESDLISVSADDFAALQRLQTEFKGELTALAARVEDLEGRTEQLEGNRSKLKLGGELITDVGAVFSGEANGAGTEAKDALTAAARLRLNLDANITGSDRLRAQVEATNFESYGERFKGGASFDGLNTPYDNSGDSSVNLTELYYQRNLGPGKLTVGTHGVDMEEVAGTPTAPSGDYAFIEQFQANPAIAEAAGGAGIGYKLGLGEKLELAAAYTLPSKDAASTADGLFNGTNTASAQLTYKPGAQTALSVAYARTQEQGVVAGTNRAADAFSNLNADTNGNHVGLSASQKLGRVDVSAHGGVSFLEDGSSSANATVVNWAAQLGVNDLFGKGNYGGVGIGAVPYVSGGTIASEDAPLAAQAFYSLKVKEGLAIQPQLVYISNPNGNGNNDNVWAGSVKTTLRF